MSDGEDIRKLPLSMRKASLARLLARRVDGIFLSDFEQGEIGPDLFRHACLMGLEYGVTPREHIFARIFCGGASANPRVAKGPRLYTGVFPHPRPGSLPRSHASSVRELDAQASHSKTPGSFLPGAL